MSMRAPARDRVRHKHHPEDMPKLMTANETVERVKVDLADLAYEILVGPGLIDGAGGALSDLVAGRQVVVIVDQALVALGHLDRLKSSLAPVARSLHHILVDSGEGAKSFGSFERVMGELLSLGIDRRTLIVAFGGGIAGDLAGFVAASALRGLDFVQIPTTLLSQVDSSVGGKTGINTRHGKNLVGAFHQPKRVLIDTGVLDTLPRRELLAGYAEVVKYGAIGDLDFFEWLEAHGRALLDGDVAARREAIVRSCAAKAAVVIADERESSGRRALLNFGHTFGHALEAMAGYDGSLVHGEGVAVGMSIAARYSAKLGLCSGQDAERLVAHLRAVELPTELNDVNPDRSWGADALMGHMTKDKKVQDGRIVFVLLEALGRAVVKRDADPVLARRMLDRSVTADVA
jgi:3-dehydroquinate synthase